jgi:hypothetical protein
LLPQSQDIPPPYPLKAGPTASPTADPQEGAVAIVGYKVRITRDELVVYETEAAWPDDESPNYYLNLVIEAWEEEQAETPLGTYVITYEKI